MDYSLRKLLLAIITIQVYTTEAQVNVPGFDTLNFSDSISATFYESIQNARDDGFQLLNPVIKTTFNSTYARSYNDGPIWTGKGLTLEAHAGFSYKKGDFSFTFFPTAYFSQNSDFDLVPQRANRNEYSYQFARIDWVQQYGESPYVKLFPGQTEIKYQKGKFIASVSTQNYSVGPSIFNPIILSRQAAGFPSLRIGTDPMKLKISNFNIGRLEANLLYGLLLESDYFDNDSNNDTRYFNGLFIGFSPAILPNLTIGLHRVLYKDTQFFEGFDLFSPIKILDSGVRGDSINTNDTFDGLASVSIDWNFPEVGFRAYGEYGRNDFTGNLRWTLQEPEHSRAYTIGFEKNTTLKNGDALDIIYEHTNLSRNHTYLWRAEPPFYTHGINKQGYTHDGQIVGAGIGTGGNGDTFTMKYLKNKQVVGLLLQRIEFNKDYFVTQVQGVDSHDVEYSAGLSFQKEVNRLIWRGEGIFSYNLNRYYQSGDDKTNLYLSFGTRIKLN